MTLKILGRRALAIAGTLLLAPLAHAGYFQWDMVELPASSGASCGNGTPYRFFVNRTPFNKDTVVLFEGGGACWDQAACEGRGKLSASNPDGIPADYLSQFNTAAFGLVTPFTSRLNPFQSARTQSWNQVYLPYCTGDVHTGSKVAVYSDTGTGSRVQYHRGQANASAAAAWLRANLGRPNQLVLTGFSAGGVGATANYPVMRDTLQPTGRATLLADSGPLMPAPRTGTAAQYPSLPLHNRIREAWGLDEAGGMVTRFAALPGFDTGNLGTIGTALSQRYPSDRFAYMAFLADANFSAFSYEKFYPDIANAPDASTRVQRLYARWLPDVGQWVTSLAGRANVDFHIPFYRPFNDSHCLTIIDFSGTGIEEKNIADLTPFVNNAIDRGPTMKNLEFDLVGDLTRPVSGALGLLAVVLALFG